MTKRFEALRSLWKITEMRDGCVYSTQFVENVWVELDEDMNDPLPPPGHLYGAISTKEDIWPTIRVKKNKEDQK